MYQLIKLLIGILFVVGIGLTAYSWVMFNWAYSVGERIGYLGNLTNSSYLCKTWGAEISSTLGSPPESFYFTVRDEVIAQKISANLGRKVVIKYEQHIGLPVTCFGNTQYFVFNIEVLGE